jgi:nitronate monooxygenase
MSLPQLLQGRLRLPVIGSPLFIVSGPDLVIAQCKAGIVGSFPALNARPIEVLREWIVRIKSELAQYEAQSGRKAAPFAVNQICHSSNDRLEQDMAICTELKVPIIITSLRAPKMVVDSAHSYGGLVFHDIINIRHAKKAVDEGVDGLIAVCAGAGGHAGMLSPFALVPELRRFWKGTIALSGSIASGGSILAAQAVGADLAYIGTRFIATREANADDAYKQALVEAEGGGDIVYTNLFTGVHGNYLRSSIMAAGLDPENLPQSDKSKMNFGSGGNMKQKAWRDIWGAGQGVGQISDAPSVGELVDRLEAEYRTARSAVLAA